MLTSPKRIGFLSFGAWHPGGGLTHTGGDALRQTVEPAVAAEEIGIDGAFVRVHHFARQLSSPFPLLAAVGVRTSRIEIGTGVIDMSYENPLYMGETAVWAGEQGMNLMSSTLLLEDTQCRSTSCRPSRSSSSTRRGRRPATPGSLASRSAAA